MATGALDSNGIWQYGEDDSEATASALLNKLGSSVSTEVGKRKILQVVNFKTNTQTSTTSTSFVNSNLSATITPSSASSKILILASFQARAAATATGSFPTMVHTLFRGNVSGTNLGNGTAGFGGIQDYSTAENYVSYSFIDAPGTTSAQLYTVALRLASGAASVVIGPGSTPQSITLIEVAA